MTLESLLLLIVGTFLSIVQELWDGWGPWLGEQSKLVKRLVTLGLVALAAVVVFGFACLGWLGLVAPGVVLTCDEAGVLALLEAFFLIGIGGQFTHLLVKKS
jgi:hypothetical protein